MKFKAKIDAVYFSIYLLNVLIGLLVIWGLLWLEVDFMSILLSVTIILEILFVTIMFFNCYYMIKGDKLKLVIGLISIEIRLSDIKNVSECSNMAFSFALARARLEILLGTSKTRKRNKIFVSPKDKSGFVNAIASKEIYIGGSR